MVAVSVARVNAKHAPQGVRRASFPPVLEPARQCPRDDKGRRRSAMYTVKAAPADEVRAVRHARRRKALTLEELRRGFRGWMRKQHPRVE